MVNQACKTNIFSLRELLYSNINLKVIFYLTFTILLALHMIVTVFYKCEHAQLGRLYLKGRCHI